MREEEELLIMRYIHSTSSHWNMLAKSESKRV